MACGRPALVSDLAGCAIDLIVPGRTGDVIQFGDWNRWTDAIVRYSNQQLVLEQMGKNAMLHIRDFTPECATQGFKMAIRQVCSTE